MEYMPRWTKESRKKHSELMRALISQWKPWKTAGVKTPEGKAISSQNAKLKLTPEEAVARAQRMEIEALLISLEKQRSAAVRSLRKQPS